MRHLRLKRLSYLDGIALGLFLAAAAFLILFMLIDWKIGEAWIGVAGNMLVAIFSVGAAFLGKRDFPCALTAVLGPGRLH
jgi:hypothetical protein